MTYELPNEHRNNNGTNNSTPRREERSRRNSGRRASTSNCNRESISAAAFQNSILAARPALVTTGAWPRTAARSMSLHLSPSIAQSRRGRVSTRLRSDSTFPDNSASVTTPKVEQTPGKNLTSLFAAARKSRRAESIPPRKAEDCHS
jgi:hypothetical protein